MRLFSVVFAFFCIIGVTPVSASDWIHDGVGVRLVSDGMNRRFSYETANEPAGIAAGAVLFEGKRDGNTYSGTAYWYSPRCGSVAFPVSGVVSADQSAIVLAGIRPQVDASCKTQGSEPQTLTFNLRSPTAAPVAAPVTAPVAAPAVAAPVVTAAPAKPLAPSIAQQAAKPVAPAVAAAPAAVAHPTVAVVEVRSQHRYKVELVFYSKTFARAWPGNNKVYPLADSQPHTYRLNCTPGEKICYGAWEAGKTTLYWGVGKGAKQGCGNCCMTCGETKAYTLN